MSRNLSRKPKKCSLTVLPKECKEKQGNNKNNKLNENMHNGSKTKRTRTQQKSIWTTYWNTMPKRAWLRKTLNTHNKCVHVSNPNNPSRASDPLSSPNKESKKPTWWKSKTARTSTTPKWELSAGFNPGPIVSEMKWPRYTNAKGSSKLGEFSKLMRGQSLC